MIKKEENGKGNGVTYVPSSHNTKPKLSQGVVTPFVQTTPLGSLSLCDPVITLPVRV